MEELSTLIKQVYELCTEDSFMIEIMKELGFEKLRNREC